MKKYRFIIGNNAYYNSTHLRRVTLINYLFASSGLVDVISWSGFADSEEAAMRLAIEYFKGKGMKRQVMGNYY